jgi:hypothetical protein
MSKALAELPELPAAQVDAVCVIPNALGAKYFHTAQAAYILAKQAGFNMTFATCEQQLPEAEVYIVPSMMGWSPITQEVYLELIRRAEEGASVLFTTGTGFVTEIETVLGLESLGMRNSTTVQNMCFEDVQLPFAYDKKFLLRSVGAEVLAQEEDGTVIFSRMARGKGEVFFLNFPMETMVWNKTEGFTDHPYYRIYQRAAQQLLDGKPVRSLHSDVALTIHPVSDAQAYAVAVNYSDRDLPLQLSWNGWKMSEVLYGSDACIKACDAVVLRMEKA